MGGLEYVAAADVSWLVALGFGAVVAGYFAGVMLRVVDSVHQVF